jgi:hypothetical protein
MPALSDGESFFFFPPIAIASIALQQLHSSQQQEGKERKAKMAPIAAGVKVPSIELDHGFPPKKVNVAEHVAGKKVIILGLPGAFTPT